MEKQRVIRDVMSKNPITLHEGDTVLDAARCMRDADIGDVLVLKNDGTVCGIVTDRDIVVRGLAKGGEPSAIKVSSICSQPVVTLSPDDTIEDAVDKMREKAIRRIPVVDGGRPVGMVSLGDLAVTRDSESALGQISAAAPNN